MEKQQRLLTQADLTMCPPVRNKEGFMETEKFASELVVQSPLS